jgi:hypothetical protein
LLAYLTEHAVALSMGVSLEDDPKALWDLELQGGERVEVKTVILDVEARRSPAVQINLAAQIRFLAIVIFRPDLTIETAKMIPAEALNLYGRPGPRLSTGELLNVRVTPHLLHYQGAWDIPLGQELRTEN